METIPDRSRRDADIAARLAALRRTVAFDTPAAPDPGDRARPVRWLEPDPVATLDAPTAPPERDVEATWLRAELRRVTAARLLWQLAACWWFVCWLVAAGVALALIVR